MKKWFRHLCLVISLLLIFAAFPISFSAKDTFYDTARMLLIKSNLETDAGFSKGSSTVQGGCTDGEYAYFIIHGSVTRLLKYRLKDFKLVDMVDCHGFDHANDITYNSKGNRLVVTNNAPNYDVLTVLNPDTLQVTSNQKLKIDVYCISYDAKNNQYIAGISGTYDYAILDSKLNVIKKYSGVNTGYTRQGCDSDDDYIYFVQGDKSNIIAIYNKSGKLIKKQTLDISYEVENIFHIGTNFYATFHYYGNYIYRLGLSEDKDITFKAKYDGAGGKGKMETSTIVYGKDNNLSKCTFTKDGYIFAGWTVRRDCDGRYLGYTVSSNDYDFINNDDVNEYVLYRDESPISETTRLGDITLKAMWARAEYTIKFDSGDSDAGTMPDVKTGYFDEYTIPKNRFIKNGYVFTSYHAQRTYDDRYYGYAKGCSTPKWLSENDLYKYYDILEDEVFSKMTYDGSVILTPNFKNAFTYNEAKTSIKKYNGVDRIVNIPEDEGVFSISQGAFSKRIMYRVNFNKNITTVAKDAFIDCNNLIEVYFNGYFPDDISYEAFRDPKDPVSYLEIGNDDFFLGWFIDKTSPDVMKTNAQYVMNENFRKEVHKELNGPYKCIEMPVD